MEEMNTGVYEILNTINGVWYRGKTEKETFEERWYKHKCRLNRGEHGNSHLQEDWDEHGEEAFTFRVLSRCAPEFCSEMEKWWIGDDYNDRDISYNKQGGGDSGYSISDEKKRNISEAAKIAMNRPEVKRKTSQAAKNQWKNPEMLRKHRQAHGKPFTCTYPNGDVKEYPSLNVAVNDLGVGRGTIGNYLEGKSTPGGNKKTAHLRGCVFQYC